MTMAIMGNSIDSIKELLSLHHFIDSRSKLYPHGALFLAANVLWSIFPALIYWHRKRSFLRMIWALVFGFYSQFALFWIGIYSLLTMRDSRWLTREIP